MAPGAAGQLLRGGLGTVKGTGDVGKRHAEHVVQDEREPLGGSQGIEHMSSARSEIAVHFGDGHTVRADLMLVSAGRGPLVEGLGLERTGVKFDRRTGIASDTRRRTSVPHIYAVCDCAGYWQLAHTAFREGEVAAQNACGHDATVGNRTVPRPVYTDPEIASVGLNRSPGARAARR